MTATEHDLREEIRQLQALNAALLAACKLIASYAVAGEPLSVGDIREVTAAIARAEAP